AAEIQSEISRDAGDPRSEPLGLLKRFERAEGSQKRLLTNVRRVVSIPQQAIGDACDPPLIPLDQLIKGPDIPGERATDALGIGAAGGGLRIRRRSSGLLLHGFRPGRGCQGWVRRLKSTLYSRLSAAREPGVDGLARSP